MALHYEFYLPHVDLGVADKQTSVVRPSGVKAFVLDRIDVVIDGRPWALRKPVALGDDLVPFEVYAESTAEHAKGLPPMLPHALLQVAANGLDREIAKRTASQISWMLSLALGQRVAWNTMATRDGAKYSLENGRTVHVAVAPSKGSPVKNEADGVIARFLETFHPIYLKDEEWWNVTIDWYAIARETPFVEVTGLISSVLLDRVCHFILKGHQFPKQIDENLKESLTGAGRKEMKAKLDEFLRSNLSAKWDKSDAIISRILEMNEGPPYAQKVAAAFGKLGLPVPVKAVLDNRNRLAHVGELEPGTDFGTYHDQIVALTTTMLLKAAAFHGPYFLPGMGRQVG